MIPLFSRESVRALDTDAVERLGVPSIVLMENAGLGATELLMRRYAERLGRVVLVGGPGQNGGDAWVIGRQLFNRGHRPLPVLVGDPDTVAGDARTNLEILRALGLPVREVADASALGELQDALMGASLVVDGLFGTGLDRPVRGVFGQAIACINANSSPCIALDLPSGVDANRGSVLGTAVRAQLTATFAAHKLGLHQYPGRDLAGEIVCVPIGVPCGASFSKRPSALLGPSAELIQLADVATWMPRREADAHKGTAGHVLGVAGSPGRTGAALLAGLGALRAGAGLATLATRAEAQRALDSKVVELMTLAFPDDASAACREILAAAENKQAAFVGPGLGLDSQAIALARALALTLPLPTVLDADALTALGSDLECLKQAAAPRVLTPHPGEAARLLGTDSGRVQADRYAAARALAERSGAVIVLKGARTLVATASGVLRVCERGTPALATAGSGDVLSGVLAALAGQLEVEQAACAGVLLHAYAGELAAASDRGLLAREVSEHLPHALQAALEGVSGVDSGSGCGESARFDAG